MVAAPASPETSRRRSAVNPFTLGFAAGSVPEEGPFQTIMDSINLREISRSMTQDSFPIRRLDHVRHYVNNARQAAYYYQHVFGFSITGYGGLETGQRNQVDWLLTQKDIRLIFSAPVRPDHPLSEKICEHGDYVQDI